MSKSKIERRNFKTEVRAVKSDAGTHIEGYASTFNQPYSIGDWFGDFEEIVAPTAFNRAIAEGQDVRCLFNHDPNHVLGRTKPKTLTLSVDSTGLAYSCTPPANSHVTESIERGDIDGSSFGFIVIKDQWNDERDENGRLIKSTRTILDVDLYDVGPVTYPANDNATAAIRSLFPQGMPSEFRSRFEARNAQCQCDCAECMAGNCADCSDAECDDPNCEGEDGERSAKHTKLQGRKKKKKDEPKTKKVDGVDLTADCFAYVGDPDKTDTWKLPIKFPGDDEKTKTHIRNALARFDQTEGIPEDEKSKVKAKIDAAAKEHGIDVSEENAEQAEIEKRKAKLKAVQASL